MDIEKRMDFFGDVFFIASFGKHNILFVGRCVVFKKKSDNDLILETRINL